MSKSYTQDATQPLVLDIPTTLATDLSRGVADKCAIACRIKDGIRTLTGIEPEEVRVYRTRLQVKAAGTTTRWALSKEAQKRVRQFDDPDIGVFAALQGVVGVPPAKVSGTRRTGKSAAAPRRKTVDNNMDRVRSVIR